MHVTDPSFIVAAVAIIGMLLEGARRLARMEAKLGNGITAKLARVEERQHIMVIQVAQVHAILAERHEWDGEDRRHD